MIKILLGGSPCTFWSIAQKNNRETEAKGLGWELFKNYLIAKQKFKPDYFLYENNKRFLRNMKGDIIMSLVARTNEMYEEVNEMFENLIKLGGGFESIKDMDDESLLAIKKMLKLMDKSKEFSLEMAAKLDKIDSIERKLDLLLERK